MQMDIDMLNAAYEEVKKSMPQATIEKRYDSMVNKYQVRVYRDKLLQSYYDESKTGAKPRPGYIAGARDLPAGSSLEEDIYVENEVVAAAIRKDADYERRLAESNYSHCIIFVIDDYVLGTQSFRIRHAKSLPDEMVEDCDLFSDKGIWEVRRRKPYAFTNGTPLEPRRIEAAPFAKSPKGNELKSVAY